MRHLLLTVAIAASLSAPAAGRSQEATGTTGVIPPDAYAPSPAPTGPRVRTTIQPPVSAAARPTPASTPSDLPLNAQPGQCFARVQAPGRTETYQARVLVTPERKQTRTVAAVYEDAPVQVLVTPERVDRVRVPATYRTVTETVVVQPERVRVERVPAEYRLVDEQVLVAEGRLEWRPAQSLAGPWPADPRRLRTLSTGEVYCLVEVPPVHRTIQRRVEVSPARTLELRDPPLTKQVTRRVIDRPARVEERVIPAVYRTENRPRLVTPARTETTTVPAEWRTVDKTREVGPARLEWREAPCARLVTPDLIRRVQAALVERGYGGARPDGVLGPRTREALERFQKDKGLHAGALTLDTLKALGVDA